MTSSQSPRDPASGLAEVPGREPGGAPGTGPMSAPGAPAPIRAMPASRAGASCTGPARAAGEPPSPAEPWASPLEDHETRGSGAAGGFTAPILAMIRRRRRCASRSHSALQRERSWRRPIFPRSYPLSIFGAGELNCRVRDGNGCGLSAWVTRISRVMVTIGARTFATHHRGRQPAHEPLFFDICRARRNRAGPKVDPIDPAAAIGWAAEKGQALDH